MNEKQTVISKGVYSQPQPEQVISLKEYIFTRNADGKKQLFLRFFNDRAERCRAYAFMLYRLDAKGRVLGEELIESTDASCAPCQPFALSRAIDVEEKCTDFRIRLISATFNKYKYSATGAGITVSYDSVSRERGGISRTRIKERSVSSAKTSPWIFVVLALAVLAIVFGAVAAMLDDFTDGRYEFSLSGVEYEFVDRKDFDRGVVITGYSGFTGNMLITSEIEGYPVLGIEERAFKNNSIIKRVRVENLDIPSQAFYGCKNLELVELSGVRAVGDEAFSGCGSIETLSVENAEYIGERAFFSCYSLESVTVSHASPDTLLRVGNSAFSNCTALSTVSISQMIEYPEEQCIFENDFDISSLHLRNFNYAAEGARVYETHSPYLISLFCDLDEYSYYEPEMSSLRNVSIDYIGSIPQGFSKGVGYIESFSINNVGPDRIGAEAFSGCAVLESFSCASPIAYVEDRAFANTAINYFDGRALKSVGNEAFSGCINLSEFKIGVTSPLESLGESAFEGCVSLASFEVPLSVKTLPKALFRDCSALRDVDLSAVETLGAGCFYNCTSLNITQLPKTLVRIYSQAFDGCTSLTEVDLSAVTEIGDSAFARTGLVSVKLPENAVILPDRLFEGSKALASVKLPSQLENTGNYTFNGCTSLSGVTLPASLKRIGDYTFGDCTSLTAIELPDGLLTIGNYAFTNTSLSRLTLPVSVELIGSYMLNGCNSITEITVPYVGAGYTDNGQAFASIFGGNNADLPRTLKKVTVNADREVNIPQYAFYMCSYIEEINLSGNVYSIGTSAFATCTQLRYISIPSSVERIGNTAFYKCFKLFEADNLSGKAMNCQYTLEERTTDGAERSQRITVNGCVFTNYSGEWYLTDHSEGAAALRIPTLLVEGVKTAYKLPKYYFYDDKSINSVSFEWGLSSMGESCFESSSVKNVSFLGASVNSIPSRAFYNCALLTRIDLPEGVSSIGESAFLNCTELGAVTLPASLDSIASDAFSGCNKLYDVYNLSNRISLTLGKRDNGEVARRAVVIHTSASDSLSYELTVNGIRMRCHGNTALVLGYSGSSASLSLSGLYSGSTYLSRIMIGEGAFENNSTLQSVTLGNEVILVQEGAFSRCSALKNVRIYSTSLSEISDNAFYCCYQLRSVDASGSAVKRIGSYAFYDCGNLLTFNTPAALTEIGDYAFYNCSRLLSITLPSGLRSIGSECFYLCSQLYEVYDISSYLTVVKGNTGNGYVASYASSVFTSSSDSLPRKSAGGCYYVYANNAWLLYQVDATASDMFEIVTPSGIGSFRALPRAFVDLNCQKLIIPEELVAFSLGSFTANKPSTVYYKSSKSDWARVSYRTELSGSSIYCYDECVHDSYTWTYDLSGNISTAMTSLTWSTKSPTCFESGEKKGTCPKCSYSEREFISKLSHSVSDGVCTRCDAIIVTAEKTLASLIEEGIIVNDEENPFKLSGGRIISTNSEKDGTSVSLKITADKRMKVYFSCNVYSESSYDEMAVYVNGVQQMTLSGVTSRSDLCYELRAGDTLTVTYSKDGSGSQSYDRIELIELCLLYNK